MTINGLNEHLEKIYARRKEIFLTIKSLETKDCDEYVNLCGELDSLDAHEAAAESMLDELLDKKRNILTAKP